MSRNRLSIKDVKAALEKAEATAIALGKTTNPQSVEIRLQAQGRIQAFEAVLYAMRGDRSLINIWADRKPAQDILKGLPGHD